MTEPDFASWARMQRLRQREPQAIVAIAVGKSRSWVAQVERGEISPRAEDVALMARHFKIAVGLALEMAGFSPDEVDALSPRQPSGPGSLVVSPADLRQLIDQAVERAVREVMDGLGLVEAAPARPETRPRKRQGVPTSQAR